MSTPPVSLRVIRHCRPLAAYPVLICVLDERGRAWLRENGYPEKGVACGFTVADEIAAGARADGLPVEDDPAP